MDILSKYNEWDNTLQKEYNELWPQMKTFNWDGVVSPEEYFNSEVKVMFLNRETYGDDYNINEAIKNEISEGKIIFGNNPIKTKIKNRLRILSLIDTDFHDITDLRLEKLIKEYNENDFRQDMLRVAYCNIKKSDGRPKSYIPDLKKCANKNKEILIKQISFFNPSVIVGGNIVDGVLEEIMEWGDDLYRAQSHYVNIFTIKICGKDYPFVDICHPAARKNNAVDCVELFNAIKHVEKENPGFWKSRCGLKCFE